jgi:primary-amine oxidase
VSQAKLAGAAEEGSTWWREGTPVVARDQAAGHGHGRQHLDDEQRAVRVPHPLEPLDADEISLAVQILRQERLVTPDARFVSVSLNEPLKSQVPYEAPAGISGLEQSGTHSEPGATAISREAFVVLLEPGQHTTYEAVVSLTAHSVMSWRPVPGVYAPVTLAEYAECELVTRADPKIRAGFARRGITSYEQVLVEPWGIGTFTGPEEAGRRVAWTLLFYRERPDDNPYAKPIHGLHAIVDLDEMTVVRVEDTGVVPLPPGSGAYAADRVGPLRDDLKPLEIIQPSGPSFVINGWEVRWQRWRIRLGFTAREGLVLHTIGYEDQGRVRPVIWRASVAELFIPYADPRPFQGWRNAFDIGEYGIGIMANSLELGCDCLGEIRYLDVDLVGSDGEPYTVKQAICLHEEDFGLLWKHFDPALGTTETRRSRRLVISFIITAGNYEYAFYWYFYQDGTIEFEVKLTGIVLTSALAAGESSDFGTLVAPQTLAGHHQHFLSVRLDMAVDGLRNTVYEVDTEAVPPGPANPFGNAFRPVKRSLRRESEAQRVIDPLRGRYWLVANPGRRNELGHEPAYKLVPGSNVLLFSDPNASVTQRAAFATRHLWVTPYRPDERFPAGDYPNQHPGGAGLPEWTKADRPIEDTDVVLWYTLGSHHITRPEDWPVMPAERAGFTLKPTGFFDRNPALDVAPSPSEHC